MQTFKYKSKNVYLYAYNLAILSNLWVLQPVATEERCDTNVSKM